MEYVHRAEDDEGRERLSFFLGTSSSSIRFSDYVADIANSDRRVLSRRCILGAACGLTPFIQKEYS